MIHQIDIEFILLSCHHFYRTEKFITLCIGEVRQQV